MRGVREICSTAVMLAVASSVVAGCGKTVSGTPVAASADPAASVSPAATTNPTSSQHPSSTMADPTALTCVDFLKLDDAAQQTTLEHLAARLGYRTMIDPGNYRVVRSLCRVDQHKLVKEWLGRRTTN